MSAPYPPGSTDYRCARCNASPGARCRTESGTRATAPHVIRLVPRYRCERCGTVDDDPTNVAAGYCRSCREWTGSKPPTAGQDALEGI
jgi:lipopolysaccharide biosynthesis regulator YciM